MPKVEISLTQSEALVLFEMLTRYVDQDTLSTQDQSEQRALWNLQCLLESQLVDPFDPEYQDRLRAAQDELRDNDGNDHSGESLP